MSRNFEINKFIRGLMCAIIIISSLGFKFQAIESTENILFFDINSYINSNVKCAYPLGSPEYEGRISPTIYKKYGYDFLALASVTQGIINRDGPIVYYKWRTTENGFQAEDFWYSELSGTGEILSNKNKVIVTDFYGQILIPYISKFKGIVLWDENVPSTYNVALTIAGCDNLLPIRYDTAPDSLFTEITSKNRSLQVIMDLTGKFIGTGTIWQTQSPSTGSAKCDAYIWAKIKYIDAGKLSKDTMAYGMDAYSPYRDSKNKIMYWDKITWMDPLDSYPILNVDYFVMKKAFVMDLMMVSGYKPNDDINQPDGTDLSTLNSIMSSMRIQSNGDTITVCGFSPWNAKYTNRVCPGGIGDVDSEWRLIDVLSYYNAQLDADAISPTNCLNASILTKTPLNANFNQNSYGDMTKKYNPTKRYVSIYMGDYDCSAWTSRCLPQNWNQSKRGQIPLAWCVNASLAQRVPNVFNYLYDTKTSNDFFVAGDNGSGYLNPIRLDPLLIDKWKHYNITNMDRFDLSICGFAIPGYSGKEPLNVLDHMSYFVPDGIITISDYDRVKGTPVYNKGWIDTTPLGNVETLYGELLNMSVNTAAGEFKWVRGIRLQVNNVVDAVNMLLANRPDLNIEIVDPYTYFNLFKQKINLEDISHNKKNLLLNKVVTWNNPPNSAEEDANNAIDESITTHWCSSSTNPNYISVDMGLVQPINSYILWHAGSGGESGILNTRDFKIQVSIDGIVYNDVQTVKGNTQNFTNRNFPAVNARYVRLNVTAGDQIGGTVTRINGFEAYYDPLSNNNIATQKAVASCQYNTFTETPDNAVDEEVTNHWASTDDGPHWMKIDLGATYDIDGYTVYNEDAIGSDTPYNTRDFTVQISDNGVDYSIIDTVAGNTADVVERKVKTTGRYIKLYITEGSQTSSNIARIRDFAVYGNLSTKQIDSIVIFDNCDIISSWNKSGNDSLSVDTTNKKEGTGSLSYSGAILSLLQKKLNIPIDTGLDFANGNLGLWLYIEDVNKINISESAQIEISSSGVCDVNEYCWDLHQIPLVNGWNNIKLKISDATKIGSPNLSNIDYFRIYNTKSDAMTQKIDNIYFYNGPQTNVPVDNCDTTSGWSGDNTLEIDTAHKTEGTGSLSSFGDGTIWFQKRYDTPVNTGVTMQNGHIGFWFYLEDVSKINNINSQIEISSSKTSDVDEYYWRFSDIALINGWNKVKLKLSNAQIMGSPDLSKINYFRIYGNKTGLSTQKIDDIYFFESNESADFSDFEQPRTNPLLTYGNYRFSGGNITNIHPGSTKSDFIKALNLLDNATATVMNTNETVDVVGTGAKVHIISNETIVAVYTAVISGDISADGVISISDLALIKLHLLQVNFLTNEKILAGDIMGKGFVSISDLLIIKKYLLLF